MAQRAAVLHSSSPTHRRTAAWALLRALVLGAVLMAPAAVYYVKHVGASAQPGGDLAQRRPSQPLGEDADHERFLSAAPPPLAHSSVLVGASTSSPDAQARPPTRHSRVVHKGSLSKTSLRAKKRDRAAPRGVAAPSTPGAELRNEAQTSTPSHPVPVPSSLHSPPPPTPVVVVSNISGTERQCCVGERGERTCWGRGQYGRPYKILFHANELNFRGTSVGLFNYAHFFEELACGESYIATNYCASSLQALPKFEARFPGRVFFLPTPPKDAFDAGFLCPTMPPPKGVVWDTENSVLLSLLRGHGIDAIFTLQENIDVPAYLRVPQPFRVLVQGVFFATSKEDETLPPGVVTYAALSEDLECRDGVPVVPRIVDFPSPNSSEHMTASFQAARAALGIPETTRVFCRHGGERTFDIEWARLAVCDAAKADPAGTLFLFMNTEPFHCPESNGGPRMSNLRFLPGTSDLAEKQQFLSACDACLHARLDGETFGNAIAECSMMGKPVLTYSGPLHKYHLRILSGEWTSEGALPYGASHAVLYASHPDLLARLVSFNPGDFRGNLQYAERMRALFARFSPARGLLDFLRHFGILADVVRASRVGGQ